jgi:predicted nucleic acid-binding protein
MTNYYLDTAIWRDYYENRSDRFRPLGEWALALIKKIIRSSNLIVYSDIVLKELREKYSNEQIQIMFYPFTKTLVRINIAYADLEHARRISCARNVHFNDVLHAVLAKKSGSVLITRDKHFENLSDFVQIFKPEDLI